MRSDSVCLLASIWQLRRKRRVAKTETALRILPQPFFLVQKADRTGDCVELVSRKALRDIGEIEWRLFKHGRNLFGELADGFGRGLLGFAVGFAAEIIGNPGAVGVGVGDALVTLFRNAF